MKIEKEQLSELMCKHIYALSENELNAIAFLLDIQITKYEKDDYAVKFMLTHRHVTVFVECGRNSNSSMGRSKAVVKGVSKMRSYGGCFSFANIVSVFRTFYSVGYDLTIQSPEKMEIYKKKEWQDLVLSANDIVRVA